MRNNIMTGPIIYQEGITHSFVKMSLTQLLNIFWNNDNILKN